MPKRKVKPLNIREELKRLNETVYSIKSAVDGIVRAMGEMTVPDYTAEFDSFSDTLNKLVTPLALIRGSILALDQDHEATTNIQEETNTSLDRIWKALVDLYKQDERTERIATMLRLMLRRLVQLEAPKIEGEALAVLKRLVKLRRQWQEASMVLGDKDYTAATQSAWDEASTLLSKVGEGK